MLLHKVAIFGSEVPEKFLGELTNIIGKIKTHWEVVTGGVETNFQSKVKDLSLQLGRTLKIMPIDVDLEKVDHMTAVRACNHDIANYSDWGICIWKVDDKEVADLLRRFIINGKNMHVKIVTEEGDLVELSMEDKLKLLKIKRRFTFDN